MRDEARIAELYDRLTEILHELAERTKESARDRCPYRAADDRCTFAYGCRNLYRRDPLRICARPL